MTYALRKAYGSTSSPSPRLDLESIIVSIVLLVVAIRNFCRMW